MTTAGKEVQYSAKIINPENKGGHIVEEWRDVKFTSVADMRDKAFYKFETLLINHDFLLGYLSPGRGVKGKQYSLTTDDELKTMYTEYFGRKSVNLWLKAQVKEKKRSRSDTTDDAPPSKRSGRFDAQMKRMDDVQEIVEKLKEKHSNDKYTPEQLHCWANLIQMKKHSSYESPPEYRYFTGKVSGGKSSASQASPGKRIHQRSECIDQLKKLHKLMEDGIISEEQYQEMHKKIMADIQ